MIKTRLIGSLLAGLLSACGGGSSPVTCSGSAVACVPAPQSSLIPAPDPVDIAPPPPSRDVQGLCAVPRAPGTIDPLSGRPYGDQQGSLTSEKLWVRSFVNETYLWYDEVRPVNAASYNIGNSVPFIEPFNNVARTQLLTSNADVVTSYFNSQRTLAVTASGRPKDQFHFTYPTPVWTGVATSGAGVGFGFTVAVIASTPPRKALVAYADPGTIAAQNNITRGAQLLSINGIDVANGTDLVTLNEGLFTPVAGKNYTFGLLDPGSTSARSVTLTAVPTNAVPVQNVSTLGSPNSNVGYILFNEHIATAEGQLIDAVNKLKAANGGAGVTDLVLDLRYNGGGYLAIASELAYMIAGPSRTAGKFFEKLVFNNKKPFALTDAQTTTPFQATTVGFASTPPNQSLPQLGLARVFVLTGKGTCSASESIINGLRGAGITVIQIGNTTCGKPYGFYAQDNCNTTYFTIQFNGVNAAGFGEYADGFVPAGTGTTANNVPGCVVADDFSHQLGDPAEARLAAALQYRLDGTCPALLAPAARLAGLIGLAGAGSLADPQLYRTALQENRFYLAPPR